MKLKNCFIHNLLFVLFFQGVLFLKKISRIVLGKEVQPEYMELL